MVNEPPVIVRQTQRGMDFLGMLWHKQILDMFNIFGIGRKNLQTGHEITALPLMKGHHFEIEFLKLFKYHFNSLNHGINVEGKNLYVV